MRRYHYLVSGVGLISDCRLDGLDRSRESIADGWRLVVGKEPEHYVSRRSRRFFRCHQRRDGSWVIAWPHEGAFWIVPARRRVEYALLPGVTHEAFLDMLLGPIISYLLLLDGHDTLHGSAVKVGRKAIVFLGSSRAGKSTVAMTFLLGGFGLIVDDVLSLQWTRGRPHVIPGYPEIRLWPASGRRLLPEFSRLPRVVPSSSKRRLDPRNWPGGFVKRPVPIRLVYEIRRSTKARRPTVKPLSGRAAFLTVARNLYNTAEMLPRRCSRQFDLIWRLAGRIPVRRLLLPRRPQDPGRLRSFICKDSMSHKTY